MSPRGNIDESRKILVLLAGLLATSAAGASWWYVRARAAAVEFPAEVLAMLPSDVSVVAYADIAALREEPLVQRVLRPWPPPVHPGDGGYAEFYSRPQVLSISATSIALFSHRVPASTAPTLLKRTLW